MKGKSIKLKVYKDNKVAIKSYIKLGFSVIEDDKTHYFMRYK